MMKKKNGLDVYNVTKLYNKNSGIKNISVGITSGEIVAFVGPNGVGKTTLVRSIAGLATVSQGVILLDGIATSDFACKTKIGYMQENLDFYKKMTVYEVLDLICKVKFNGNYYKQIDDFLFRYNLYDQRNYLIGKLSLGMKRKLSIIMSLIGEPRLIILDEPTNGVDTSGIIHLKNDLLKCSKNNQIIVITSHVLDWVERICTRCIFMKSGMIVKDMTLDGEHESLENEYEQIYEVIL